MIEVRLLEFAPVIPFEPVSTVKYMNGDEWVSQIKWDGVRMLVYYDGNHVNVVNRKRNDRTIQYPELVDIRRYCAADAVILDGEVIALENGKPSFHRVMKRDGLRKPERVNIVKRIVPITYMIFDVLYVNGDWVTEQPLKQRQHLLSHIITENDDVQLVTNHDDAEALFNAVVSHDLEGIVMKDVNSRYKINGKDKRWQKKKVFKELVAVVGGVTYRSNIVNALLLGLYDESGRLRYIGHAGGGKLTQRDWRHLTAVVSDIVIADSPFINVPERNKGAIWIKPKLTVKIRYLEWTRTNTLRQPIIQSLMNGDPKECTFAKWEY